MVAVAVEGDANIEAPMETNFSATNLPMKNRNSSFARGSGVLVLSIVVAFAALPSFAAGEQKFDSPEAAVAALTSAAKDKDTQRRPRQLFRPGGT